MPLRRSCRALLFGLALSACTTPLLKPARVASPAPAPPLPDKAPPPAPQVFSLARLAEGAKLLDNLGKVQRSVSTRVSHPVSGIAMISAIR